VTLREFDIDAAAGAQARPAGVRRARSHQRPGSRHPKRWQDAVELLEAGIDVWTTLERPAPRERERPRAADHGVLVRETLPDRVLDKADEIEFIDLPPDEQLRRLAEGRCICRPAARAVQQSSARGTSPRCASWLCGERPSTSTRRCRATGAITRSRRPAGGRAGARLHPTEPGQRPLVRGARRLAARLRAEWIVVWVESPGQPALSEAERRQLAAAFALASQLGAETATISGRASASRAALRARTQRQQLVVGSRPTRAGASAERLAGRRPGARERGDECS